MYRCCGAGWNNGGCSACPSLKLRARDANAPFAAAGSRRSCQRCTNAHPPPPACRDPRLNTPRGSDDLRTSIPGFPGSRQRNAPVPTTTFPKYAASCRDGASCAPGVILRCRLGIPDVAGVTGKLSTLQRADDGISVADAAARRIHQVGTRFSLLMSASLKRCSVSGCSGALIVITSQTRTIVITSQTRTIDSTPGW